MRRFLIKISQYFLLLILLIFLLISSMLWINRKINLPFTSNSVSFNAKAKFIHEHESLFNRSKFLIIGSSMSLNNLDCQQIQDSFKTPVINLSSWGMKPADFDDFNIWTKDKTIMMDLYFEDFGESDIKKNFGYPLSQNKFIDYVDVASDFYTYLACISMYKEYIRKDESRDYSYLVFDATGTILFNDPQFVISKERWNFSKAVFSEKDMADYVDFIIKKSKLVNKIIICFSPGRRIQYSSLRSNSVKGIEKSIMENCKNVIFINKYDSDMPESDFVDMCHMRGSGAKRFTADIINDLKKDKNFNVN